jgi:hypothetical protein
MAADASMHFSHWITLELFKVLAKTLAKMSDI